MDAPFHFVDKDLKMVQINLERFVCDEILCKIKKGSNQSITKKDIIEFEKNMEKYYIIQQ